MKSASYRLDYIGEMEVGEKKVVYDGSLDRLYNHDFELFRIQHPRHNAT